jgi:hypothetical protein
LIIIFFLFVFQNLGHSLSRVSILPVFQTEIPYKNSYEIPWGFLPQYCLIFPVFPDSLLHTQKLIWRLIMTSNKFHRLQNVIEIAGVSPSTLWRMEQSGQFPKRIKIGQRAVGWLSSEIENWLKGKHVDGGNQNGAN